ncbi:hypothetical protein [Mycolicibacterium brumae]|uniref:Uncharacterized protein n=1 Tax=Mycolicibacterium brumae TaxID=85968 RepID=A0A2G5P682_9MYCO|nr:hypothetical protein [Mycolicibacterium brumae]MCV7194032.1 hypothetical protein [Mycolicibacterium brumae]PIB73767.1 hypothetical protein CQY22_015410 [Mycolicibacterium brumae]RWA19945.1 hypothetical protein MBRU_16135 [Mycolicibacterium brumae DSM 44177]UWW09704.1 hypothetical protein L2Z93_002816 [Mycolicibacterium brumae]
MGEEFNEEREFVDSDARLVHRLNGQPVHRVHGRPWVDAVITLLQPRSPYRPWIIAADVEPGDQLIVTLDTDPVSVIAGVATVGDDADIQTAIERMRADQIVELTSLEMLCGLDDWLSCLKKSWTRLARAKFGHSSLAAARTLLSSKGRCGACGVFLPLAGSMARDQFHIHTTDLFVDGGAEPGLWDSYGDRDEVQDWPAVLCMGCHESMRSGGFASFPPFLFARRPECPDCGERRTETPRFGFPIGGPFEEPWVATMGCVVREPRPDWVCGECGYEWRV